MKKLILLLLLLSPTIYAANDLDNWNGNVSKEVREKLNNDTTTYKTLSSVKATAEQSSSKYTDSVTKAGTRVGVTIEALKVPTSKLDIAKTLVARHGNKVAKFAAGSIAVYLGEAAIKALINEIGWVMDEGGKITKINSETCNANGSDCTTKKYLYVLQGVTYSNQIYPCNLSLTESQRKSYTAVDWPAFQQPNGLCRYLTNQGLYTTLGGISVQVINNPSYDSLTTQQPSSTVSDAQFQQAIVDQLTNAPNSDLSNQLATDAYTLQDISGKATDSLAKADTTTGINDAAKTLVDAAKSAIANDANPQNAKLTSGSSGKAETETETKNEDGTTGQPSKSSTNFELPAFCDWASAVCEWFDWTKETPDDTTETDQPDIDDQGIFTRTFDTAFSLSKDCPADIPFNLDTQYLKVSNTISLKWLCIIFTALGYPLVFASNCIGIWILYEAVIRRQKAG